MKKLEKLLISHKTYSQRIFASFHCSLYSKSLCTWGEWAHIPGDFDFRLRQLDILSSLVMLHCTRGSLLLVLMLNWEQSLMSRVYLPCLFDAPFSSLLFRVFIFLNFLCFPRGQNTMPSPLQNYTSLLVLNKMFFLGGGPYLELSDCLRHQEALASNNRVTHVRCHLINLCLEGGQFSRTKEAHST